MAGDALTLVLDNEVVRALADVNHRNHRRALAFIEVVNHRSRRHRQAPMVIVAVAVRVEAGWDRRAPAAASLNRISRARDVVLDAHGADRAAELRREANVSVVDATVAQVADAAAKPVAILTSDVADMRRLAAFVDGEIRIVPL